MNEQFLWITKNSNSEQLSRSSRLEEARIRRHVQRDRLEDVKRKRRSEPPPAPTSASLSIVHLKPEEKRSLDYFIHRTAPEWSGWQDGKFWNGLAIQAAQQDQAIAHGLVAIAAWHEGSSKPSNSVLASHLSQLASSQQSKALTLLGSSQELSYSTSLISCVILASLQSYSCDYREYQLLRSGAAILEEVQKSEAVQSRTTSQAMNSTIIQEMRILINRLRERLCMMGDMPAALSSSAQHHEFRSHRQTDLPFVPKVFDTLRDARDCLETVLNWGHDHVVRAQTTASDKIKFCDLLEQHVKRWEHALKAIKLAEDDNHSLALLRIAALNGIVLLSTCCLPDETVFDSYTPVFHRIMHLVESITTPKVYHDQVSFGIDCGLIDIVAFVGSRCREARVRHSALQWLQNSSRVEGERLSGETAQIVQAWINLEGQGDVCDPMEVPESSRRRLLAGKRYHDQHLVKLLFVSYPYDPTAGATVDELWIRTKSDNEADVATYSESKITAAPDAIFGPGHAAFLDRDRGTYHRLYTTEFHFPIPRV